MKKACVITVGSPVESLGALKLARWLRRTGWDVTEATEVLPRFPEFDLHAFSVVFSWRIPRMIRMIGIVKESSEVWVGGPAVTFHPGNAAAVESATGIRPTAGIDNRFESEPGDYPMVYFSRGCPAYTPACGLCPVPRIEGNSFRFFLGSRPAALLLDNNLSALPADYQDFIIRRYAEEWKGGRVDANSGFEPHTFTIDTLNRWAKFPLLCWRFGYDDLSERDEAQEMMALLKRCGYHRDQVRVYTMIGNEPKADCFKRIREVINAGFYPWPQRLRPLNWMGPDGTLPTRFDWDEPTLIAAQKFYASPGLWKTIKPEEFHYQGRFPLAEASA